MGAGAGVAIPFHGDFDFTPFTWDTGVRVGLSEHVLVEVAGGESRHTRRRVETNLVANGATIGRFEQITTHAQRFAQVNVLATGATGRLRVSGGGGVGLLQFARRTETTTTDCSPGIMCGVSGSSTSRISGSVQAVGGVDVSLTTRVALYGQGRFLVPLTDPGGSDLRVTAGVRVGLSPAR